MRLEKVLGEAWKADSEDRGVRSTEDDLLEHIALKDASSFNSGSAHPANNGPRTELRSTQRPCAVPRCTEDLVNRAVALVAKQGKEAFGQLWDKTGPFVFMDTYVFARHH